MDKTSKRLSGFFMERAGIDRTHRGLVLTKAGKSMYQDAKYIVQYSKESVERAREAMRENEEVIRVGVSPMTPPQVFVELWPQIQKICMGRTC